MVQSIDESEASYGVLKQFVRQYTEVLNLHGPVGDFVVNERAYIEYADKDVPNRFVTIGGNALHDLFEKSFTAPKIDVMDGGSDLEEESDSEDHNVREGFFEVSRTRYFYTVDMKVLIDNDKISRTTIEAHRSLCIVWDEAGPDGPRVAFEIITFIREHWRNFN